MERDCKTCEHSTIMYRREREDMFTSTYLPAGYVRCAGPRYRGRSYFIRDGRQGCPDYSKRARNATKA